MPRIPPQLLMKASRISPNLARLLPICRDLASARNELRWLTEHVTETQTSSARLTAHQAARLSHLCRRRRTGEPLQYILGSQPFGDLEIQCRTGVLVPRAETEAYTLYLSGLLRRGLGVQGMRIVDFCTGTGCIPLLLYAELRRRGGQPPTEVRGVDISPAAIKLSGENLRYGVVTKAIPAPSPESVLSFTQADLFDDGAIKKFAHVGPWHVLVSNPPYISREAWSEGNRGLSISTRKFEPKLALVPRDGISHSVNCRHEDAFYERLLKVAQTLRSGVMLLELGDADQARRVLTLVDRSGILQEHSKVEVWRDYPDMQRQEDESDVLETQKASGESWLVNCRGSGNIRCIFIITEP
ncbi:hypothetical protein BROUX41_005575 [Berkeleyomyces rouxiae]|uniref:uncharacterized protein n=1 Tax=Berkeleyomyces rouxiae TaxID=2035830 RepID=UPI003B79E52B